MAMRIHSYIRFNLHLFLTELDTLLQRFGALVVSVTLLLTLFMVHPAMAETDIVVPSQQHKETNATIHQKISREATALPEASPSENSLVSLHGPRWNRFFKVFTVVAIPVLYVGVSTYLREGPYADHPEDLEWGSWNGVFACAGLGGITGIFIGFGIGFITRPTGWNGLGRVIVLAITVGLLGAMGGGTLGVINRSFFKENRGGYYTAATIAAAIPTTVTIIAIDW
jgi:hypothetical protein